MNEYMYVLVRIQRCRLRNLVIVYMCIIVNPNAERNVRTPVNWKQSGVNFCSFLLVLEKRVVFCPDFPSMLGF